MKRILLFISFCLCMQAYLMAQPVAQFNTTTQNLGAIAWRKPVNITYRVKNTGDKPLVISNVTTSCGCTTAMWSEHAIAPSGEGFVTAIFDAASIGKFYKEVSVYCNASTLPLYLSFEGEVVAPGVEKEAPRAMPYNIGMIGLNKEEITFDSIHRGTRPTMEIEVVNNSTTEYTPVLMHLPPYLKARAVPETLSRGKAGKIFLTLDTYGVPKLGITTASVYLARYSGDKVGTDNEIPVSIVLLPDFSKVDAFTKANPPQIELSATELNFEKLFLGEKKTQTVIITNKGKSKLNIREMQIFSIALSVKLPKKEIKPGESVKMKITVLANNLPRVKRTPRILMITNDPKRPQVEIKVKAALYK